MSEDLTKKLPKSDSEKIALVLTIVQNLETSVDKIELRLTNLEQRLDRVEQRLDRVEQRLDHLEQRLDGLEKKVEERLYDTRPIWQKVVGDIAQLQESQRRLEETLSSELGEIKFSVRDIDRRMGVMNDTMLSINANYRDMDNRVHELELQQRKQPKPQT